MHSIVKYSNSDSPARHRGDIIRTPKRNKGDHNTTMKQARRQERMMLDMGRYLEKWFGRVPIAVQLGDFLQLRPTAKRLLCEWHNAPRASDTVAPPASDEEELADDEAAQQTSNAAELGRMLIRVAFTSLASWCLQILYPINETWIVACNYHHLIIQYHRWPVEH